MINPIRSWSVRRRPPSKTFIGLASRYRAGVAPAEVADELAELLVQLTVCPSCTINYLLDCSGKLGRWDERWLREGDDGHREPRFHVARTALTQRHLGEAYPLRRPGEPPHVCRLPR